MMYQKYMTMTVRISILMSLAQIQMNGHAALSKFSQIMESSLKLVVIDSVTSIFDHFVISLAQKLSPSCSIVLVSISVILSMMTGDFQVLA